MIAGQAEAIAELQRKVARLERLVSRNSGNSGMPPSADDLPGRTPPREKPRRGKGKRQPGKQPGAPGSHLAWSEDPDEAVPHFPEGTCECGAALASAADLGVAASHQQVEVPLASGQTSGPAADFFEERQLVSQTGRPPATARSSARRWLPAIRQQPSPAAARPVVLSGLAYCVLSQASLLSP